VNGVLVGIVLSAGAVTTGEWSAVTETVPPLVSAPPLTIVPTDEVNVPSAGVTASVCWLLVETQWTVNPLAVTGTDSSYPVIVAAPPVAARTAAASPTALYVVPLTTGLEVPADPVSVNESVPSKFLSATTYSSCSLLGAAAVVASNSSMLLNEK